MTSLEKIGSVPAMKENMRLDNYYRLLSIPGLRSILLLGLFAKVPVVTIPIVLTLHVTLGQQLGFGHAGLVIGAWTVGVAVGSPIQGRYIDQHGLRSLFVCATTCQALFWALAPQMSFSVLVGAVLLSGLVIVPGTTMSRLAIAALVLEELRHTAFVLDSMLTNVSYMIGPSLGVLLATQASTTTALVGVGFLLVLSGGAVIFRNPPMKSEAEAMELAVPRPPVRQWLNAGLVAALACTLAAGTISSGTEIAVVGTLKHLGEVDWTSLVLAFFAVCSMIGGLIYGGLQRGWPAAALVGTLGIFTIPLGLTGGAVWLGLALIPAALLYAPAFASTAASVSQFANSGARASVMSLYSTAMTVGTALGGVISGTAIDEAGPIWGFAAVGGLAVLVSILAWQSLNRSARSEITSTRRRNVPSLWSQK